MKWLMTPLAAMAAPAEAHIVFAPAEAVTGRYYAGELQVGHGCGELATSAIRIEIPIDIISARPRPKAGWTMEVERVSLPTPILVEGHEQKDKVVAVTWRGSLPADQFDGFGLMLKLPLNRSGPFYLPVRQVCGSETVDWADIPATDEAWGTMEQPAALIMVYPAAPGHVH